jgi:hypothetical protein
MASGGALTDAEWRAAQAWALARVAHASQCAEADVDKALVAVELMRHASQPALQQCGFGLLARLLRESPARAVADRRAGAIAAATPLLRASASRAALVLVHAYRALAALAAADEAGALSWAESEGAAVAVVAGIRAHAAHARVQDAAVVALFYLLRHARAAACAAVLDAIVAALHAHAAEACLQRNGCALVRTPCVDARACRARCAPARCAPPPRRCARRRRRRRRCGGTRAGC